MHCTRVVNHKKSESVYPIIKKISGVNNSPTSMVHDMVSIVFTEKARETQWKITVVHNSISPKVFRE